MQGLRLEQVSKLFSSVTAVAGVTLHVSPGEIVAILGPSGCGKSTLLGLIAGLIHPDQGRILWDEQDLNGIPPHRRSFGLMFQDFALFPHLSVYQNIAFGLQMAHLPTAQIQGRVQETLELVGLPGFQARDVNTLSGGEMQRVALARSLAPHPRLLMLDEPLGALDRTLRERLVQDLAQILHHSRQTAVYVTHDQEEAFTLADRVAIMNNGQFVQVGRPDALYRHPASTFVARFLGLGNLLPCQVLPGGSLDTPIGKLPLPEGSSPSPRRTTLLLRFDGFSLGAPAPCQLTGKLVETSFRGAASRASVRVNETLLELSFDSRQPLPEPGSQVCLSFRPEDALQVLDE